MVVNRIATVLGVLTLLALPGGASSGQDTTTNPPERLPEIQPLAGDILMWRAQSKKAEKLSLASRITPQDRVGTPGGNVGRISIDAACIVTLKGVTATEADGLSVDRGAKTLTLRLHHGRLLVETFAVDLTLETPHGKVEAKSAYFLAEVGREATRLVVIDGELKVSNDLGKIDVGSGETVVAKKGSEPAKGPPADPDKDLAAAAATEESFNLFKNPGFEQDLKEWNPLRYANKPLAAVDDKIFHGGKKSLRIQIPNIPLTSDVVLMDGIGESQSAVYTLLDPKTLKTGSRYLLRFWVRTEDYTVDGKSVPLTFLARGLVLPEGKGGFFSRCTCPAAQKQWRCVRFVLEAEAAGANRMGFNFPDLEKGAFSGSVWVDDFFLAPLPARRDEKAMK